MKRLFTIILFLFYFLPLLEAQNKIIIKPKVITKYLPFGLKREVPADFPKVALVLSGGGARGLSQVGIIAAIKRANIPISEIVGTSMGSIVGGLYAAGYSIRQIDSIVTHINWKSFFSLTRSNRKNLYFEQKITEDRSLISFRMDGFKPIIPTSINNGEKVATFLNLLTINSPLNAVTNFDSLLIPFRAVSTNLVNGKKVVLKSGSLSKAMRASSSVSFLLPPVEYDSLLLVDGGVIANVPVSCALNEGNNFTIAVNVSSPLRNRNELNFPWEIADQLVSIPSKAINKQDLKAADIIIKPDLKNHKNTDFSGIDTLIKEGYKAAERKIDLIKQKLKKRFFAMNKLHERFFKNIVLPNKPNKVEKMFFDRFSNKDSISNKNILYQLSLLQLSGEYRTIYAEIDKRNDRNILKIIYTKNPVVKRVSVLGLKSISEPKEVFTLIGKPYNSITTLKTVIKLLRKYRSSGFTLTSIKRIAFNKNTGVLLIEIDEGKLKNIIVEGNKKTLPRIITREFPFNKNKKRIFADLKKGAENLQTTNLFKTAELELKKDSTTSLVIKVKEKPTALIRFSLRIDNENYTQGFIDVREENLFGTATELGFFFGGGQRTRNFIVEHTAHRIFNTYFTYALRGFYTFNNIKTYETVSSKTQHKYARINTGEYRQQFYGLSIGLGTQVKKIGQLMFEGKYNVHNIFVLRDSPNILPYKAKVFTILAKLYFDTQDKYPYPNSGMYFNTYFETAQKILGGELSFIKFSAQYRNYMKLNSFSNLSLKLRFGFGDNTLPLGEQFSLGGQNNFFGMRDYEYRGRQVLSASLSYRYKLPIDIFYGAYLSVRYDIGSIWQNREEIRLKDLRHGIGATVSLDTPIGPADFSVGRSFFFRNSLNNNQIVRGPIYFYFRIGFFY